MPPKYIFSCSDCGVTAWLAMILKALSCSLFSMNFLFFTVSSPSLAQICLPNLMDQSVPYWCDWDVLGSLSKNFPSLFLQSGLPFPTVLGDLWLKWFLFNRLDAIRTVIKPSSTPDTI